MNGSLASRFVGFVAGATLGAALLVSAGLSQAAASVNEVVARVSLSQQRMEVTVGGRVVFDWAVSTGARGHSTPKGSYKPTRMHKMWYSRKYDNAPMPHSVFFHEGYAVHATPHVRNLGRPASHGCVRLHPDHAEDFFHLVDVFGPGNTRIMIVD